MLLEACEDRSWRPRVGLHEFEATKGFETVHAHLNVLVNVPKRLANRYIGGQVILRVVLCWGLACSQTSSAADASHGPDTVDIVLAHVSPACSKSLVLTSSDQTGIGTRLLRLHEEKDGSVALGLRRSVTHDQIDSPKVVGIASRRYLRANAIAVVREDLVEDIFPQSGGGVLKAGLGLLPEVEKPGRDH